VSAGQPVRLECNVPIPKTNAYSFSAPDNDLLWELEVRIDIPMWPDWIEKRVLTVRPKPGAEAIEATVVDEEPALIADVVVVEEPVRERPETLMEPMEEEPAWPTEDVFETVSEEMPLDDLAPVEPESAVFPAAEDLHPAAASGGEADLVSIAESILAASRFGFERERIVEENIDSAFACAIRISKVDRTYSYSSDDRFRNGRTVVGRIEGTECEASLLTPQSRNEEIDALDSGQTLEAQCVLLKWNTIYDRLEMREV